MKLSPNKFKKALTQGTPEEIRAEVKKAIADRADLIEPSCGIPPETPTVNIKAMAEAVKTYGSRGNRSDADH